MIKRHPVRLWLLLVALLLLVGLGAMLFFADTLRELPATLFARQDSTWQAMTERKSWRVAIDPSFPPFEQLDDDGQVIGFDIDLARALAAEWGMEVEIVPLGFDTLIDAVMTGKADAVVSALPYDPRLTRDIAYSQPYFDAGIRLAVRRDSPLQRVEQLEAHHLVVELGSAGDTISRQLQREKRQLSVTRLETPDAAIARLRDDPTIDALLIDNVTLRLAQGQGAPLLAVGAPLEGNPYVIALPRRAFELQQRVEESLTRLLSSNRVKELEDKWFGKMISSEDSK